MAEDKINNDNKEELPKLPPREFNPILGIGERLSPAGARRLNMVFGPEASRTMDFMQPVNESGLSALSYAINQTVKDADRKEAISREFQRAAEEKKYTPKNSNHELLKELSEIEGKQEKYKRLIDLETEYESLLTKAEYTNSQVDKALKKFDEKDFDSSYGFTQNSLKTLSQLSYGISDYFEPAFRLIADTFKSKEKVENERNFYSQDFNGNRDNVLKSLGGVPTNVQTYIINQIRNATEKEGISSVNLGDINSMLDKILRIDAPKDMPADFYVHLREKVKRETNIENVWNNINGRVHNSESNSNNLTKPFGREQGKTLAGQGLDIAAGLQEALSKGIVAAGTFLESSTTQDDYQYRFDAETNSIVSTAFASKSYKNKIGNEIQKLREELGENKYIQDIENRVKELQKTYGTIKSVWDGASSSIGSAFENNRDELLKIDTKKLIRDITNNINSYNEGHVDTGWYSVVDVFRGENSTAGTFYRDLFKDRSNYLDLGFFKRLEEIQNKNIEGKELSPIEQDILELMSLRAESLAAIPESRRMIAEGVRATGGFMVEIAVGKGIVKAGGTALRGVTKIPLKTVQSVVENSPKVAQHAYKVGVVTAETKMMPSVLFDTAVKKLQIEDTQVFTDEKGTRHFLTSDEQKFEYGNYLQQKLKTKKDEIETIQNKYDNPEDVSPKDLERLENLYMDYSLYEDDLSKIFLQDNTLVRPRTDKTGVSREEFEYNMHNNLVIAFITPKLEAISKTVGSGFSKTWLGKTKVGRAGSSASNWVDKKLGAAERIIYGNSDVLTNRGRIFFKSLPVSIAEESAINLIPRYYNTNETYAQDLANFLSKDWWTSVTMGHLYLKNGLGVTISPLKAGVGITARAIARPFGYMSETEKYLSQALGNDKATKDENLLKLIQGFDFDGENTQLTNEDVLFLSNLSLGGRMDLTTADMLISDLQTPNGQYYKQNSDGTIISQKQRSEMAKRLQDNKFNNLVYSSVVDNSSNVLKKSLENLKKENSDNIELTQRVDKALQKIKDFKKKKSQYEGMVNFNTLMFYEMSKDQNQEIVNTVDDILENRRDDFEKIVNLANERLGTNYTPEQLLTWKDSVDRDSQIQNMVDFLKNAEKTTKGKFKFDDNKDLHQQFEALKKVYKELGLLLPTSIDSVFKDLESSVWADILTNLGTYSKNPLEVSKMKEVVKIFSEGSELRDIALDNLTKAEKQIAWELSPKNRGEILDRERKSRRDFLLSDVKINSSNSEAIKQQLRELGFNDAETFDIINRKIEQEKIDSKTRKQFLKKEKDNILGKKGYYESGDGLMYYPGFGTEAYLITDKGLLPIQDANKVKDNLILSEYLGDRDLELSSKSDTENIEIPKTVEEQVRDRINKISGEQLQEIENKFNLQNDVLNSADKDLKYSKRKEKDVVPGLYIDKEGNYTHITNDSNSGTKRKVAKEKNALIARGEIKDINPIKDLYIEAVSNPLKISELRDKINSENKEAINTLRDFTEKQLEKEGFGEEEIIKKQKEESNKAKSEDSLIKDLGDNINNIVKEDGLKNKAKEQKEVGKVNEKQNSNPILESDSDLMGLGDDAPVSIPENPIGLLSRNAPLSFDKQDNDPTKVKIFNAYKRGLEATDSKGQRIVRDTTSFGAFIAKLQDTIGSKNTYDHYNIIVEAWRDSGRNLSDGQAIDILAREFSEHDGGSFSEIFADVLRPGELPTIRERVENLKDSSETIPEPPITLDLYNTKGAIAAPWTERLYSKIGLKFGGVLGRTWEYNEKGEKVSISNQISEEAKPFMDPRNFRPGTQIKLVFNFNHFGIQDSSGIVEINWTAPMRVYKDLDKPYTSANKKDSPQAETISLETLLLGDTTMEGILGDFLLDPITNKKIEITKDNVEKYLKDLINTQKLLETKLLRGEDISYEIESISNNPLANNTEFLKYIPIGTLNEGFVEAGDGQTINTIPGGINDYYWFNNSNVVLYLDGEDKKTPLLKEREHRINRNRALNLQARQTILAQGNLQTSFSEISDATNNTRVLETKEEKEQGYTNSFHSVIMQFGNESMTFEERLQEFDNNATIAFLSGSELYSDEDAGGNKVVPIIGGKKVDKNLILNFNSFYKSAITRKGGGAGATVMIIKNGINAKGETTYTLHEMVSDHKDMQKSFRSANDISKKLYTEIIRKEEYSDVREAFKEYFGFELNQKTKDLIEQSFGIISKNNNFRQEFSTKTNGKNAKSFIPGFNGQIPDLYSEGYMGANGFQRFVSDLRRFSKGENVDIPTIDYRVAMLSGYHTNLVFTPLEKTVNGKVETLYSINSQPVGMLDITNINLNDKEIKEHKENKKYAERQDKAIEKAIQELKIRKSETNDKTEISEIESDIKFLESQKQSVQEEKTKLEQKDKLIEKQTGKPIDEIILDEEKSIEKSKDKEYIDLKVETLINENILEPKNKDGSESKTFKDASERTLDDNISDLTERIKKKQKMTKILEASIKADMILSGREPNIENLDNTLEVLKEIQNERKNELEFLKYSEELKQNTLEKSNNIFQTVEEILGRTFKTIVPNKLLNKGMIEKQVEQTFTDIVSDLREQGRVVEAIFIESNKNDILGINDGKYEGSVKEYLDLLLKDVRDSDELLYEQGENLKDHSKSSYEINILKSLSQRVKLFVLAGINDTRQPRGFAGFQSFMSPSEVLDALQDMISLSKNNDLSSLKDIAEAKVSLNPNKFGFYMDIYNKIESLSKTNPDLVNEIFYNLNLSKIDMKFVMWTPTSTGKMKLKVFDANIKNPIFRKRHRWEQNFRRSDLISLSNGGKYKINEKALDKANKLFENTYTKFKNNPTDINIINRNDLDTLLKMFGINLNPVTIDKIYSDEGSELRDILLKGDNSIIPVIMKNLSQAKNLSDKGDIALTNNETKYGKIDVFNPITYNNNQITDLVRLDNVPEFYTLGNMYIAGKSIFMYQQPNRIRNMFSEIETSINDFINSRTSDNPEGEFTGKLAELQADPITRNSLFLQMIRNNPEGFKDHFGHFLISLEALKESGEKSRDDLEITKISDKDFMVTELGMLSNSEGEYKDAIFSGKYGGVTMRKGYMRFPTLSDSSQLPFIQSMLLNITDDFVNTKERKISEPILDILIDQLISSDLTRISEFIRFGGDFGTNVHGLDEGAMWITGLIQANHIPVEYEGQTISLKRAFENTVRNSDSNTDLSIIVSGFVDKYKTELQNVVNEYISNQVDKFVSTDENNKGIFYDMELVDNSGKLNLEGGSARSNFFDKDARVVAYDYVINFMLQQKEIQTIFAGDVAQYFPPKSVKDVSTDTSMPEVSVKSILELYYNKPQDRLNYDNIVGGKEISELSNEQRQQILDLFPEVGSHKDFADITPLDSGEINNIRQNVVEYGVSKIFKSVQNNLSKRLKELLSPGHQLAGSKYSNESYLQLMINDVENISQTFMDLVKIHYPEKVSSLSKTVETFKRLNNQASPLSEKQIIEYNNLKNTIEKEVPKISAYLKTATTDAQEYTSWREHLKVLDGQGRINSENIERLSKKLENQTKDLLEGDYIKEENLLTPEEHKIFNAQTIKPLYAGSVLQTTEQGYSFNRFVYIKSSSFPLIPELTQYFPETLNNLRKNVELFEGTTKEVDGKHIFSEDTPHKTVRVSFQSANKVGAVANPINVSDLYSPITTETKDIYQKSSGVELNRSNFYIQQDKPFHGWENLENNKRDTTVRATQFEKIILGDGITDMGEVFPANMFSKELLDKFNLSNKEFVSGKNLQDIYNEIYKREQKMFSERLLNELGIETYTDISNGNPLVMENLSRRLNKQLSSKQDREGVKLVYRIQMKDSGDIRIMTSDELALLPSNEEYTKLKASFKIPPSLSPSSRKLESVLNSIIKKNNINLDISGFSSPLGSSEGFNKQVFSKNMQEKFQKEGMIFGPNYDLETGLKSTREGENGEIKAAQIFISNHFRAFNKQTGKYEIIDLKEHSEVVDGVRRLNLPEDLLSMFSFRIPTSSHQSGMVIEIAGILPDTYQGLMIVPEDSTIQIGEDFDIDVRYAYQYNFIKDGNTIKKISSEEFYEVSNPEISKMSFEELMKTKKQMQEDTNKNLDKLWDSYKFKDENGVERIKNLNYEDNKAKLLEISYLESLIDRAKESKSNLVFNEIEGSPYSSVFEDGNITQNDITNRIKELKDTFIHTISGENLLLEREYETFKNLIKQALRDETSNLYKDFQDSSNIAKNEKLQQYSLENDLIAMYKSVMLSPSSEMQTLITKVLSTDFAEESAELIEGAKESNFQDFNIYSPIIQRDVMKLGADGKLGIGVHSNAVTMNSMYQQLGTKMQLKEYTTEDKDGNIRDVAYDLKLGNLTFDGFMGSIYNQEVKDSEGNVTNLKIRISESLMESQNSATDNQKLEIMGRRNENSETINVFSIMQMNGLSNDGHRINGKVYSYPSLFIAQPIIQKYVETIRKFKSSTNSEFGRPDQLAIEVLTEEFLNKIPEKYFAKDENGGIIIGRNGIPVLEKEISKVLGRELNSGKLYDRIVNESLNENSISQILSDYYTLSSFLTMKKPAKQVADLQKMLNIEREGLGISYHQTIALKEALLKGDSLPFFSDLMPSVNLSNGRILGDKVDNNSFQAIIGDKIKVDNAEIEKYQEQGYILIETKGENSFLIKPVNHYSHKIVNSIALGYNMWNSIFPYNHTGIRNVLDYFTKDFEEGSKKSLETKYDVYSAMQDYILTDSYTLFGDNPTEARAEMFFDIFNSDGDRVNTSLGSYLLELFESPDFSYLGSLPLFQHLEINVGDNGSPTIIKYNPGEISELDDLKRYNSLNKLVNSERPLADWNGFKMTEGDLMREMLKYSLMSNQENGAIGFRNILPITLLEKYNVDKMLQSNSEGESIKSQLIYAGPIEYIKRLSMTGDISNRGEIDMSNSGLSVDMIKTILKDVKDYTEMKTGVKYDIYFNPEEMKVVVPNYSGAKDTSLFIKQYIQHNPKAADKTYYFGFNKKEIQKYNKVTANDFEQGKVDKLVFDLPNNEIEKRYITLFVDKKPYIFEAVDVIGDLVYYNAIPRLGEFGFNEYDAYSEVGHSLILSNNIKSSLSFGKPTPIGELGEIIRREQIKPIVREMAKDYDGRYSALIELFKGFVNFDSIEVSLSDKLPGDARYTEGSELTNPKIEINSGLLEYGTKETVQDAIMEELIHHVTVSSISPFVNVRLVNNEVTWTSKNDENGNPIELPSSLVSLLNVYKQAFEYYKNKHGADAIEKSIGDIYNISNSNESNSLKLEDGISLDSYRIGDIHEFIAGLLIKDSSFQLEMSKAKYLNSGGSIWTNFVNALRGLLKRILPEALEDSYAANGLNDLISFLEYNKGKSVPKTSPTESKLKDLPTVSDSKNILDKAKANLSKVTKENNRVEKRGEPISTITEVKLNDTLVTDDLEVYTVTKVNNDGSFELTPENGLFELPYKSVTELVGFRKIDNESLLTENNNKESNQQVERVTIRDSINNTPILKSKLSDFETLYIPKSVYELAYANDTINNEKQSLETIIRRGGYSIEEFNKLLPNWEKLVNAERRRQSLNAPSTRKTEGLEIFKGYLPETFTKVTPDFVLQKVYNNNTILGTIGTVEQFMEYGKLIKNPNSNTLGNMTEDASYIKGFREYVNNKINEKPLRKSLNYVGSKDLNIREKYFKGGVFRKEGNSNSNRLLNLIGKSEHNLSPLANHLKEFNISQIPVVLSNTLDKNLGGQFDPTTKVITISENNVHQGLGSEGTILHEILHGLSYNMIESNTEVGNKWKDLYKEITDRSYKINELYAMSDPHEMLAGVFTDAFFINELMRIPPIEGFGIGSNVYDQIKNFFKELFKISEKDLTLFDQVFEMANQVLEAQNEASKVEIEGSNIAGNLSSKFAREEGYVESVKIKC